MKTTRIDRIRAVLKRLGPMTVLQISEATKISPSNVAGLIADFRENPGRCVGIRKSGKVYGEGGTFRYIFEVSNEPDDEDCSRKSSAKGAPRLTREEIGERRQLKELAKRIQPFRDPMIWALFGDGLSTNTLEAEGYRGGEVRASPGQRAL